MELQQRLNFTKAAVNRRSPCKSRRKLFHFEGDVGEFAVAFDLHGGGVAGFQRGEGGAEFVYGFDLLPVERVDDVAGAQSGIDREAVGDDRCDQDTRWNAHVAEDVDDFGGNRCAYDAETRDYIFCWVAEFGESRRIVARFVDWEDHVEFFPCTDDRHLC